MEVRKTRSSMWEKRHQWPGRWVLGRKGAKPETGGERDIGRLKRRGKDLEHFYGIGVFLDHEKKKTRYVGCWKKEGRKER